MNKRKEMIEWIICILIALSLALFIRHFIGTPTIVKQKSMYPTLEDGDRLILNRIAITTHEELKRGEIVTLEAPMQPPEDGSVIAKYKDINNIFTRFCYHFLELNKISYIKRIIALPGEHIEITEEGQVYINGELLKEKYLKEDIKTSRKGEYYSLTVPENCVFVMGDNRQYSTDSREIGCIPINKIEGKVWIRFWPLKSI